jgi:hypothetical protein
MRPIYALTLALLVVSAHAAENTLPEFTGDWVNGGPYTKSGVKGKAVLLFLVERG